MKELWKGREKGSMLAETLVALALLGVLGTTYLSALSTSSMTMGNTEERVNIDNLARAQMEYVKNQPYIEYIYGTPDVPPDYARIDDPSNPDAIVVPNGYLIDIDAQALHEPDDGIQEITVTVYHDMQNVLVLRGYKVDR